ncbi:MAG: ACT domain-containing protein, partial [Chloroflexi bacterium]|nr:ACT domain-containing protein [Chloroflexota bacterium]
NDLTSVAMEFSEDKPGQLFGVLKEFAERNLNLTKIESRPTRLGLGKYYFLVDIEGHEDDPTLADALILVEQRTSQLIKFGSYPRADTESFLTERVRETATLHHYRCQREAELSGIRIDLLLEAGEKRIGVEVRATSSSEGILKLAQSFRRAGLTQAIFVFADPTVAERARATAAEWPEELAATAVFTTAEHISELL